MFHGTVCYVYSELTHRSRSKRKVSQVAADVHEDIGCLDERVSKFTIYYPKACKIH